jgi:hypothetical protein
MDIFPFFDEARPLAIQARMFKAASDRFLTRN